LKKKGQRPIGLISSSSFMLNIYSLNYLRLIYLSKYSIDIRLESNGLVTIKDSSNSITSIDLNIKFEEFQPIQSISSLIHLFQDEIVEKLLRQRKNNKNVFIKNNNSNNEYSAVASPNTNSQMSQGSLNQQQTAPPPTSHVFLPPTSPAFNLQQQQQQRGGGGGLVSSLPPPPSPVQQQQQQQSIQSPGMGQQNINPPSVSSQIIQSPVGYGSPALPNHNSPSAPPHSNTNLASMNQAIQSPGYANMSPAPNVQVPTPVPSQQQQQPFNSSGIQSPATLQDFSLQSPASNGLQQQQQQQQQQTVPIKSPFSNFVAPSPQQPPQQQQQQSNNIEMIEQQSKVNPSNVINNKSKKTTQLFYLSQIGFLRMLTPNQLTQISPLESFLASNHLKKLLLKVLRATGDNYLYQIKNPEINLFKASLVDFQITNEMVKPTTNYNSFSLNFYQTNEIITECDLLTNYFNSRVLCTPYRITSVLSYLNMFTVQSTKILKELLVLLNYDLNYGVAMYQRFNWRLKLAWTMPIGFQFNKNSLKMKDQVGVYQQSLNGFQKRDKLFYILFYLMPNQQNGSMVVVRPLNSILLLLIYDPMSNVYIHEILRPINDINNQIYNTIDSIINSLILNAKQRGILILILNFVINCFLIFFFLI
jgi:hypothetical protein